MIRRNGSSINSEIRLRSFDDIESYPQLFFDDKSLIVFLTSGISIQVNSNDEYMFCFK